MSTKLTLTIEESVIIAAKAYAQKKGRSLSHLIENYLKSLSKSELNESDLSPAVRKLLGSVQLPENFDYKKEMSKGLMKKYSK